MRPLLPAILALLACIFATPASAHAFPDNSLPHVGATVAASPPRVQVWFDGELEPGFSTLVVKNAAGAAVSVGKGGVDAKNHRLLETTLPQGLPPGTYTVYWSVAAHDGHHSAGHFSYTVKQETAPRPSH